MSLPRLIVVGYAAGYGGNFFTSILHSCLKKESEFIPINQNNEYVYSGQTDAWAMLNYMLRAYHKGPLKVDHLKPHSEIYVYYERAKNIFNSLYHPDKQIFIKNLVQYIRKNSISNDGINLFNSHYYKPYDSFSLSMIESDFVFFLLMTNDRKKMLLFELLLHIKKNQLNHRDFVEDLIKNILEVNVIEPFDSAVMIEVGELFLSTKSSNLDQVESILSESLGKKITVDKELISDYSRSNVQMLNDFLDLDIEEATYLQVARATKRKLQSLL